VSKGCGHPGCDIEDEPFPRGECSIMKPLSLYIPAGTHMHLDCQVHPNGHVLRGQSAFGQQQQATKP